MELKPEMSFFWLPFFPADTNNSQDDVDWGSGTESAYEDISEEGDDFWLGDTDLDGIGEGPSDDIMTFRRNLSPPASGKCCLCGDIHRAMLPFTKNTQRFLSMKIVPRLWRRWR